jgi:hypothetical protein
MSLRQSIQPIGQTLFEVKTVPITTEKGRAIEDKVGGPLSV